jgi:hypothetical protein
LPKFRRFCCGDFIFTLKKEFYTDTTGVTMPATIPTLLTLAIFAWSIFIVLGQLGG